MGTTNIPPSFSKKANDDFAEIVYYVKAYVDIPFGRDAVHRAHFSVLRPMPISQHLQKAPVSVDKHFDVTCCCCIDKGKVNAKIFMDRTLTLVARRKKKWNSKNYWWDWETTLKRPSQKRTSIVWQVMSSSFPSSSTRH